MAEYHLPSKKNRILMVINPIMGLLMISQLLTGLNVQRIPYNVFGIIHVGGGVTLFLLFCGHLTLNWGWFQRFFLHRKP